jgi:hypothetical protein
MAKKDSDNTTATGTSRASGSTVDSMEQKMLAFAEQLGRFVGTVQAKAEGWLDPDALNAQISTVRDSATALLDQLGGGLKAGKAAGRANAAGGAKGKGATKPKTSTKGKVASMVRASATSGAAITKSAGKNRSGGAVDAPGKKHRKPMPSESGATGAPRGEGSRIAKLRIGNEIRQQRRRG